MGIAPLDRHVIRTERDENVGGRLSEFRSEPRYVLLGEPGIGKSTVFELEAAVAGTTPIRARDFAGGERPAGRVVFIDALEEFRIGEPGIDRLLSLVDALKSADYAQWRIACRAISLPPPDMHRLTAELGGHVTLQLDLLDAAERRALLTAVGESDPGAFIERVSALGADPLLGNPATLLLLRDTFSHSSVELDTRAALFAEATRQMSHELNREMPERDERPPAARIEAAAEIASLVLLLSVRSDLWLYSSLPLHESVVTRDDLIEARVDTEALRAAADTAMFKGDAAGFQPTHRVVAEYLAGRALVGAVAPLDPSIPALPLERALAFLTGDNDRPAPAVSGVFAWFVTTLSQSRLSDRAADLIKLDPEAVLFHGDAAALPTPQRELLISLVGRSDPWFLGTARGSSAIGGLAGDDLVGPMRQILRSSGETRHRKVMVLEALSTGRRVKELAPDLRSIVTTATRDHHHRRSALDAFLWIEGSEVAIIRQLLDDIAGESAETAAELRVALAAKLVRARAIPADELRDLLVSYAKTGDRTMGYANGLGEALAENCMPELFDAVIDVPDAPGVTRIFEIRGLLARALARTIGATSGLTAERLLTWTSNVGIDRHDRVESEIQEAVSAWVDRTRDGERMLFDAIDAAVLAGSDQLWRVDFDFARLTGRDFSESLRRMLIEAAERANDQELPNAARLAFYAVQPLDKHEELYWRLARALDDRAPAADWYDALTVCEIDNWRETHARERRNQARQRDAANATDRKWLRARIKRLRSGKLVRALAYASDVYLGYRVHFGSGDNGRERISSWLGGDKELIEAVREGWGRHLDAFITTPRAEGRSTTLNRWSTSEQMVLAWADWRMHDGESVEISLPLAFRMLRHSYAQDGGGDALRNVALTRIYGDPNGTQALIAFWAGALQLGAADLPQAHYLDPQEPVVREAVRQMLRGRRKLTASVLSALLHLATQCLSGAELLALAENALARDQEPASRRLWALVAFVLAPDTHKDLLVSDLDGKEGDEVFQQLWHRGFGGILQLANESTVLRCELVVAHLGGRHRPASISTIDPMAEIIGGSIATLARQPTEEAAMALERLAAAPELAAWKEVLEHQRSQQLVAMRAERFKPPSPRDVALALAAGPPATAADLRAVARYSLDELIADIRQADTSPWRSFWNRPARGSATPKVENDCRDLLTDRLRDRLARYGIPVRRTGTEVRSASDRRADMVVLGAGAAALPIEIKRHWNRELWTAVEDQLHPYTRSAGSNGHGIYLVLWFGVNASRPIPAVPGGAPAPRTAAELESLLCDRLDQADRGKISVVVADVSEPPPTRVKPKRARSVRQNVRQSA